MKRSSEAPNNGFVCTSESLACTAVTRGDASDGGGGLAGLLRLGGGSEWLASDSLAPRRCANAFG